MTAAAAATMYRLYVLRDLLTDLWVDSLWAGALCWASCWGLCVADAADVDDLDVDVDTDGLDVDMWWHEHMY